MVAEVEFQAFPKIPRLNRDCVITEKLDGTNACVVIADDGTVYAQSRNRLITPEDDNYGFAKWVDANSEALLMVLGTGYHYGEWWGSGIQRGYGLVKGEKRFSLFNVGRWGGDALFDDFGEPCIEGLSVVPTLYRGSFTTRIVQLQIDLLRNYGSKASPGFMRPEGVIVWHEAARQMFKVTLENDEVPKGFFQNGG